MGKLKFNSEKAMEDWLCEFGVFSGVNDLMPELREGESVAPAHHPFWPPDISFLRQEKISYLSEFFFTTDEIDFGRCDVVAVQNIYKGNAFERFRVLVIELKNGKLHAKDVAQLARYLVSFKHSECWHRIVSFGPSLEGGTDSVEIYGALLGDELPSAGIECIAELCPSIEVGWIDYRENETGKDSDELDVIICTAGLPQGCADHPWPPVEYTGRGNAS